MESMVYVRKVWLDSDEMYKGIRLSALLSLVSTDDVELYDG